MRAGGLPAAILCGILVSYRCELEFQRPFDEDGTVTEPRMFVRILRQMRERIRDRQYVMTVHADDEMDADGLTIYDLESVILTGQIVERQRDRVSAEWKYLVTGEALDGAIVTIVAKFSQTGKLVLITVFRE